MNSTSRLFTICLKLVFIFNCVSAGPNNNNTESTVPEDVDTTGVPGEVSEVNLGRNVTEILNSILKDYDKRVRPNFGGDPVVVGVTLYILQISSFSEIHMDYTVDFYLRQFWNDSRLKYTPIPGVSSIQVSDPDFISNLWVPDTFFPNEKRGEFGDVSTPDKYIRISPDGEVRQAARLTVKLACPVQLTYFPMDRQTCPMEIESFGYTAKDISYIWAKGAESVGFYDNLQLPQFKVLGYRQRDLELALSTGNYTRIWCDLTLERALGYYLIQWFFPCGSVVIISFLSFWVDRSSTTERVALGVTTVMTMTIIWSSINETLPKVSYIKAIDVYLGNCFLLCFATLLISTAVGYISKRIQMKRNRFQAKRAKICSESPLDISESNLDPDRKESTSRKNGMCMCNREATLYGISAYHVDSVSRVVFPLIFIFFNVWYWHAYLTVYDDVKDDGLS